jgi:hypothetical protein
VIDIPIGSMIVTTDVPLFFVGLALTCIFVYMLHREPVQAELAEYEEEDTLA